MDLTRYRSIVVLTGAGISHSAGLPLYRGPGALWTDPRLAELSDVSALATRREEALDFFWGLRKAVLSASPTPAHRALAAFEEGLPYETRFTLITQNVDGLHQAAGSPAVCDFHGSLRRVRCERCGDTLEPQGDSPMDHCGERMRPDIVLFGEKIPVDAEHTAKRALRDCDLFVAIGTSGQVSPAASFVRWAALCSARRVLLNLEIFDDARRLFTECHEGPADELVPAFFG